MAKRINLDDCGQPPASNRCVECGYEWQDQPYGLAKYHSCPKCDSIYWEWLNYDDDQ